MSGDPIMDAGAWRREALGLRERVRELEAQRDEARALKVPPTVDELLNANMAAAVARAELADLRAEREALVMVARCAAMLAKRLRAYGVPGYAAVVLLGMEEALDALPCWCGKPDGHASGCPGGRDVEVSDGR